MSQEQPSSSATPHGRSGAGSNAWSKTPGTSHSDRAMAAGGTLFAGFMLFTLGVLAILQGIAAIAKDNVIIRTPNYTYKFDFTTWGWIHLILGALAVVVGIGLLAGAEWARFAGIALAVLNIIANFMWLPYLPIWSIVLIAIDVFIIWALAAYRPDTYGEAMP